MIRKLLVLAATLWTAVAPGGGAAEAQPTVRSVVIEGTQLVINGSGFGTRANHNQGTQDFLPAGWHDFENHSFTGGGVSLVSLTAPDQWTIEAGGRTGSGYYAKKVYLTTEGGGELGLVQQATTGKWFISFWARFAVLGEQQSGKFFRIWGDRTNWYLSTGAQDLSIRGNAEYVTDAPLPKAVWGSPNQFQGNTWQRVDIEMSEDPDLVAVYLDGVLQWRRGSGLSGAEQQRWVPTPFGGDRHTIGIGHYLDAPWRNNNFGSRGWYNWDDIYIDYTWARVEIGDAPTWAACRHKELQIPQTWSDLQIKAKLNRGSFQAGAQLYLYVVDTSGAVVNPNSGYPLSGPRPPSGVQIIK